MEEHQLKELKKNNLLVTKDLDYKKKEATSFLRKSFMTTIMNGKNFLTQSEFEKNKGKILLFEHSLGIVNQTR